MVLAGAVDERFLHGLPGPTVLDQSASDPRQPGRPGRGPLRVVTDDVVVVGPGDRPTPHPVQTEGEGPDRQGLEVVHEVPADLAGRVGQTLAEQQPRRLEGAGGQDHVGGADLLHRAVAVEVPDARGEAAGPVAGDLDDVALRAQLAPPRGEHPAQERHRVTLGLDRAPVPAAEAAVHAGRPAVVGHRVHAGRSPVGVETGLLGRRHREGGAVHVRTRGHREGARPPCRERVRLLAGHAHRRLRLGVVRLEVGVGDRPVDHVGPLDRARCRAQVEVLLPEAGELRVCVDAAAADRRRQRVHVPDHQADAVRDGAPERAGLGDRVGAEEVALDELHLVVRVVAERPERRLEIEEVVPTLLEDDDRPPRCGEDVGDRRAGRTGADDDGVAVEAVRVHGPLTSASVQPRGSTSPSNAIACHPAPCRLPP